MDPNPSEPNGPITAADRATAFSCKTGATATPAPRTLQRLSSREYKNTLDRLVRASTSQATAEAVLAAVKSDLDAFPKDVVNRQQLFSSMDQKVPAVEAMMSIGEKVARELTSTPQRINELLGSCATSKSASAGMTSCVDSFIAKFGKRALRHELNQAERDFYREVYAPAGAAVDAQGLADVITVMLNAPDFTYRVEYGKDAVAGAKNVYKLSDHEIATRLAYQFWRSAPDDELLAAADRGELSSDEGYKKQVDRVLSDPRAKDALSVFAREWLDLDRIEPLNKNVNAQPFKSFAGDVAVTASTKEEMIQEVSDSLVYHALTKEERLDDWFASDYSFARRAPLTTIYKTQPWDGKSTPPRFPEGERAGLLTRAAMLVTRHGTASTSPIMKGVTIRERVLCDDIGQPDNNAQTKLVQTSPSQTTRQLVESITSEGTCAKCHTTKINPLGFITEGYDALGRVRKKQDLYDESGKVVMSVPVDTSGTPLVSDNDTRPAKDPATLTDMIIESGKAERCFSIQWLRSAEGRTESLSTSAKAGLDDCQLEAMRSALRNGSIKAALRSYAMRPEFRQRAIPADS